MSVKATRREAAPIRRAVIRPRGVRRAFLLEARLHQDLLVGVGVLSLAVLALLLLFGARLGFIPLFCAVLAPYHVARSAPARTDLLRASLGISRADGVRGRVLFIALMQAGCALVAFMVIGLSFVPGIVSLPPAERLGAIAPLLDASTWVPGIVWAWVLVGRDCLRRPPQMLAVGTFLVWFVVHAALGVWFDGEGIAPIAQEAIRGPQADEVLLQLGIAAVVTALGIGALALRARRWVRQA